MFKNEMLLTLIAFMQQICFPSNLPEHESIADISWGMLLTSFNLIVSKSIERQKQASC